MTLFAQGYKETFLQPLTTISGTVPHKHTLPILSNVLIERQGNRLSLTATDLNTQLSTEINLDGPGQDRAVTVDARKLIEVLRALPSGETVSLFIASENVVQLKCAKSSFDLQTLSARDFPKVNVPVHYDVQFKLPVSLFRSILERVYYACALADVRAYLNGVFFQIQKDCIVAVATDGHRLAYALENIETGLEPIDVLIPRKTVLELLRLFGENSAEITISIGGHQARFDFGQTVLVSKLIEGRFPDYERVIPKGYKNKFMIERRKLQDCLSRVAVLASDKFKIVQLVVDKNVLKLSSTNAYQEHATEQIDIDYVGPSIDIGFNVDYLADALSSLGGEKVEISLGSSETSALVKLPDADSTKCVVMPMRV